MRQSGSKPSYGVWMLSCLFAAMLLIVIAAALLAEEREPDHAEDWDTLNRDIEQTLKEWEDAKTEKEEFPLIDGKVPINIASAEQLDTLPGIGPSKAEAIVSYREEHGPFTSLEDLLNVKGIGEKTLENLKDLITLEIPQAEVSVPLPAADPRVLPDEEDASGS